MEESLAIDNWIPAATALAMEPTARTNTGAVSKASVCGVNSNGRSVILTKGDRKKKDSLFRTTLSPRFLIMRDTIT